MSDTIFRGGRTAVVTGAAKGLGLAAARRFAGLGMQVYLVDRDIQALKAARDALAALGATVAAQTADVASIDEMTTVKERAYEAFGRVDVLVNNAAVIDEGRPWADLDAWRRVLGVNLWGVINGVQAFTGEMIAQGGPAAIVNLGSKEGITTPPGNAAYSVSKAGVKVLTEQLAHELRQVDGCEVTAHLLVPGYTFTPMNFPGMSEGTEKPDAAWSAEQVVDLMIERVDAGDFYILCPDGEVTPEMDRRRIQWAADDLILNRPALSRWHPQFKDAYARFMKTGAE